MVIFHGYVSYYQRGSCGITFWKTLTLHQSATEYDAGSTKNHPTPQWKEHAKAAHTWKSAYGLNKTLGSKGSATNL